LQFFLLKQKTTTSKQTKKKQINNKIKMSTTTTTYENFTQPFIANCVKYINDFDTIFASGDLENKEVIVLEKVKNWFNDNRILISLISGINLEPIDFDGNETLNQIKLTHIYSISYPVLLRLKRSNL